MSRNSTSFTSETARAARLQHSARSPLAISQRAVRIERQLRRELQAAGLKPSLRVRKHAARLEAIVELAHAEIERRGGLITIERGKLVATGVSEVYLRASNQLLAIYRELGLSKLPAPESDLALRLSAIMRRSA